MFFEDIYIYVYIYIYRMIEIRLEYMKLKSTRLVAETQCPQSRRSWRVGGLEKDSHFAKTWCSPELHCPVKPRLTYVENVKLVGSDSAFIGSFNDCHHTRFNMI